MRLDSLLAGCSLPYTVAQMSHGGMTRTCDALVYDSRKASPDTAFVALAGAKSDGHLYAEKAYELGARIFFAERALSLPEDATVILFENTRAALAMLSDVFFSHPQRELTVIGITGTKGKTTTAYLLASVLQANGYETGIIGTVGITYGGKTYPTVNSTPESYVLHKTFREMADAGVKYVVMEVSSQSLFTHRVDGIRFAYGVFTNLSEDHIGEGEHPSFAHYKDSKKHLFSMCEHAVLSMDSPYFDEFVQSCSCPYTTFGRDKSASFTASDIAPWRSETAMGVSFRCIEADKEHFISLRIPGAFNVQNALAAIAVLRRLGLSYEQILPPLARATVPGRFEIIDALPYITAVIDYAHNGISMENLLTTVRAYHPKRIVCLYGTVGGRTKHRREELGTVTADLADFCILTTDNPDFEAPEQIIADLIPYYNADTAPYVAIVDRKEAILYALHHAQVGDVLLFCGKGHETYQIVNGVHVPFSEKAIILEECARMTEQAPQAAQKAKKTHA